MKPFRWIFPVTLLFSLVAFASLQESVPSWHWTYSILEYFQARGFFGELTRMARPYTRGEIAGALLDLRENAGKKEQIFDAQDTKKIDWMFEEFKEEMDLLSEASEPVDSFEAGMRLQQDFGSTGGEFEARGIGRFYVNAPLGKKVTVHTAISLDQYKAEDPDYEGKKWRGLAGFHEQAYLSLDLWKFRLKLGRDFLRWGAGQSGTLLFSDVCRPMDQFLGSFELGPFRFAFLTTELDEIGLSTEWADSLGSRRASRFLSAHRLDLSLFEGRLQVSASEAIVYGGVGSRLNWIYTNPLMLYYGSQVNNRDFGNTLGTLDLLVFPVRNLQVYGSLLVDDIQVEKTGPGDLEPSEIGWLAGSIWADPFRLKGLTLFGEFARVKNRTYKTANPWESLLFHNEPLGHPLGNDFDRWQIGAGQWFGAALNLNLTYSQTRKGEGSLYTPWDAPWMEHTVEEGYSEPYLTGTVEHRKRLDLAVYFQPSRRWGCEFNVEWNGIKNEGHVAGIHDHEWAWKIGIWYLGEFPVLFKN